MLQAPKQHVYDHTDFAYNYVLIMTTVCEQFKTYNELGSRDQVYHLLTVCDFHNYTFNPREHILTTMQLQWM